MNVLLVTFRLPGMNEASYRELAQTTAPRIAATPGLIGKTWLADHASNRYGGLVLFENRPALDAYLASETIRELRSNPRLTEFAATRFDTLAEASRMTRGLLPVAERPVPSRRSGAARVVAPRRRLVWRTHDTAPVPVADEPTWEDAEWR